jgi:hypothetical protein
MKPHHSQNSLLFISKLLAFSLVHGHERFSFLKCDTWYYVLCSWRGLKIRTSFLLRWWNLFMSFQSDSLIYSFKDHLCKCQHLSWTNQNNIQISHHARKARYIWRKCSWYRSLLFQQSQQSRHFEIRELMHAIQQGVSPTLPHEAKWISAMVPIKEVTAFTVFLSLVVTAKTSWRLYMWEDPHLYQNTKMSACINGTVKKRSMLPICTWCRSNLHIWQASVISSDTRDLWDMYHYTNF